MTRDEIVRFGIPPEYLKKVASQKGTKDLIKTDVEYKSEKSVFGCCCYCNNKRRKIDVDLPEPIVWDMFVIYEDSLFIKVWNKFILFLKAISSISYFYFAIFRLHPEIDRHEESYQNFSYVYECFFALDIILTFCKEYTPESSNAPVSDF